MTAATDHRRGFCACSRGRATTAVASAPPAAAAVAAVVVVVVVVSFCTPQSSAGSLKATEQATMARSVSLRRKSSPRMPSRTCSNQSAPETLGGRRRKPHSTAVCEVAARYVLSGGGG